MFFPCCGGSSPSLQCFYSEDSQSLCCLQSSRAIHSWVLEKKHKRLGKGLRAFPLLGASQRMKRRKKNTLQYAELVLSFSMSIPRARPQPHLLTILSLSLMIFPNSSRGSRAF